MPNVNLDFRTRLSNVQTPFWLSPGFPFFELFITTPRGGKFLNLNVMPNNFVGFTSRETSATNRPPLDVVIDLFDTSFDFLEDLILTGIRNEDVRRADRGEEVFSEGSASSYMWHFRYGYASTVRSSIYSGVLINMDYDFKRDGAGIRLHLTSQLRSITPMKSRTFRDSRISSIMQRLLVEEGRNGVVQPTDKVYPSLRQNNQTNWSFLQDVLLPLARNESGTVGYDIVQSSGNPLLSSGNQASATDLRGVDTYIIGSPSFIAKNRGAFVYRVYKYGRERQGLMIDFQPKVDWYWTAIERVRGVGFDFRERKVVGADQSRDNPSEYIDAEETSQLHPPTRRITDIDPTRLYVVPYDDQESLEAWAKNKMAQFNFTLEATATLVGDPLIRSGYWIAIEVLKPNGETHWTSGFYRVEEVEHNMDSTGEFKTTVKLIRFGSSRSAYKSEGHDNFAKFLQDEKLRLEQAGGSIEDSDSVFDKYAEPLRPQSTPQLPRLVEPFRDRLEMGIESGVVSPNRVNNPTRVAEYENEWKLERLSPTRHLPRE